jgi:uncharacterized protein YjbI with pentapeptide repeats
MALVKGPPLSRSRPAKHRLLLSPAALAASLQKHQRYVRRQSGGMRAFLRFADLPGEILTARILDEIDLTGANLRGANLRQASAADASFFAADLSFADLTLIRAPRADLRGAVLSGARLNNAILDGADMRRAVLATAHDGFQLIRPDGTAASLNGADLSEAEAGKVDFSNCSLKGARLRGANLRGAIFADAVMTNADLAGAQLVGATFRGAILTGIDVAKLGLPPESLTGCLLDPGPEALAARDEMLAMLDLAERWAETNGREGRPANLDGRDLRVLDGRLSGRVLPALSARGAIAAGVSFQGSQLQGAAFDSADLRDAAFGDADLRGATFRGARLAYADLDMANLAALPLAGGGSKAVDFGDAQLINVRRFQHPPVLTAA